VNNSGGCNNEWEEEVKGKKAGEGGVVYGEATPDSLHQGVAYIGDG